MKPLHTEITERPPALILGLTGDAGVTNLETLRQAVNELIARGARKVIVDCTHLDFIASLGLGELVRLATATRSRAGVFRICAAHGEIHKAILKSHLSDLMPMFKDLEEAER